MKIKLNRLICFSILLLFIAMTAGIGSAAEVNVELMSHFGGGILKDVAVSGNYGYILNSHNGLVIVDITDPLSPILAGSYDTSGYAIDVAVAGNYAYVIEYESLLIVDITDPLSPILAGRYEALSWPVAGVAVAGNYAYVVDMIESGLVIVDISDPSSPIFAGRYDTAGSATAVAVSGNYGYIFDGYNGFLIVDVSDPSAPTLAGSYDTAGVVSDVAISGNYAYLADNEDDLVIVDISDPSSPIFAGSYDTAGSATAVYVSGNYAYVTGDGLYIFNVQEVLPDTTPPASVTNLSASYVGVDWIRWTWEHPSSFARVYIDGTFIENTSRNSYVASGLFEGTTHKISIQTMDIDGNINSTFVNDSATTLTADKANVRLLGSYNTTDRANSIAISGKYAYIISDPYGTGYTKPYLEIVDISNPFSPKITGSCVPGFSIEGSVYAHDIDVYGKYAYITSFGYSDGPDYPEYLFIVDISNPSAPKVVNVINPYYDIRDVAISGNYAYVASGVGLLIWDLTNPVIPRQVSSYDIAGSLNKVAVEGNYAYVAGDGFSILDITNPSSPKLVAYVDEWAEDFAISGNYAYLFDARFTGGANFDYFTAMIDVVDISNPSAPKIVNGLSFDDICDESYISDVAGSGNSAYIADLYNGLFIMDIGNLLNSTLSVSCSSYYVGSATDIEISDNYLYVAGSNGLSIFSIDAAPVTTPTTVSYAPLYDNRLRQLSATSVLSTTAYLDIGKSSSVCRDVMLFDLSSYKTTDKISKATLSLYWYYPAGATRTSDTVVEIYRPVEWDPKYVTWNSRMSGVLWGTAGGSWFDKNGASQGVTPYASLTFPAGKVPDNKYYEFDVTQLVQEYVSGKYKNTGFFLKAKTESGNYIAFYSADASNAAVRPKLMVTSTSGSTSTDGVPVANAGADKTSTVGSAVTFDASASTDDKGIASYSWDFDASNGITSEASTVSATKTYTTAGTYTVTLTVTDTIGQKSTDTLQVIVSAATNPASTVSYAPTYDNRLRESSATTVLSTTGYIDVGRTTASFRDVMLFDLSSYKTTDTISKAILSLYWYYPAGATRTSDTIVEIYRPVEWDPKYVTWNSRMSGTPWTTAGGNWFDKNGVSQGATPYASLTFAGSKVPDNKYYEFDVTSLVQEYVSGKYKNTGFFLKAKTESGNYIAFYSNDWSNTAQRPKLTITSTSGSTPVDTAPVANAGADKTVTVGSSVTFDGSASTDDKGITSYSWDFDASNGITSEATTKTASKTYTTAGIYTVTLTVTDTIGQKSTDTLQVVVNNPIDQLPVANAGADKTATTSSSVTFDGSASTDDKGITSYSWDFDASNGITSEATGVMTAKAYTTAGTYTVTLTVTDTIGQKSSDTLQVVVSNPVSSVSYAPVYDNRLRESLPTTVLSTTAYLDIGKSSSSCRDVMLFDLSSYKTTDTISKATLSLYWYYPAGATRTSDTVVEVYRPVEWDPKYVTWNSRMSGVLWSNAGGNWYDKNGVAQGTTPYASLTFAGSKAPDNKYYEFDVTQLVQDYISGKYKNTGFFLKAKTESGNYIAFYSLESSNAAQRPKLTITR